MQGGRFLIGHISRYRLLLAGTPFSLASCDRRSATQLRFNAGDRTMGETGDNVDDVAVEDAPFPLTDTDKYVLSLTDEEYEHHDWDELRKIIGELDYLIYAKAPVTIR